LRLTWRFEQKKNPPDLLLRRPDGPIGNGMILPQQADSETEAASLITSGVVVRLRMPEPGGAFAIETTGKLPGGGVTRGVIRGRSKASRRRFQQSMGRIDLSHIKGCLLLTLTWSKTAIPTHTEQARFCDNFLKWIDYRFHGAPVAWAKERGSKGQKRWHFHLVVFASDWVSAGAYQEAWNEIAGDYAGNVDVAFKQDAAIVRYLAKYLSKEVGTWKEEEQPTESASADAGADAGRAVDLGTAYISRKETHTGRTWGWRRYKKLSLAPVKCLKIPVQVAHKVRRVLAGIQKAELRRRLHQWEAWERVYNPNLDFEREPGCAPDWIRGAARKAKLRPWLYCVKQLNSIRAEYSRLCRKGSHLARGGFNRHGWSSFVAGDGTALTEGLSAYFERVASC